MTNTSCSSKSISRAHVFLCALFTCALALVLWPQSALADVRSDDVIVDQTVEQKSLPTSKCPDVDSEYAILTDGDGKVYFSRGAYTKAQIASITKLMTAIVAYEFNPDLDETITVTDAAAKVGESSAGLKSGDTMNLQTAIKALMVHSGNDAAVSIATSLGKKMLEADGSSDTSEDACVARFVKAMNDKAADLGLKDTVFTNPHGLDYDEFEGELHSNASDVAIEVAYAVKIDALMDITKLAKTTITVNRGNQKVGIDLDSTNTLLTTYDGTIGVKTGFTDKAGYCFAGANQSDGKTMIAVCLNASSDGARFVDCQNLWDWYKAHWVNYKLINAEQTVDATIQDKSTSFPVVAKVAHKDWEDKTVKATVFDFEKAVELFDMEGNVSQDVQYNEVTGNVKIGDVLGKITFYQRNKEIASFDLLAAEDVDAPGLLEGLGIWWSRFASGCTGATVTTAESTLLNDTPLLLDKTSA